MKLLPAMLIAVAIGLVPATASPPAATPAPAGYAWSGATDLSITIERDSGRAVPGREADYTITVENPGDDARQVTVRASLPPWFSGTEAGPGGEVGDGYVDWVVTVPAADTATLRMHGRYGDPSQGQPGDSLRVAVTACVVAGEPAHPVVCDTDIAELANGSPVVMWSLVALGAALGLAAALLAKATARRRRVAPARAA